MTDEWHRAGQPPPTGPGASPYSHKTDPWSSHSRVVSALTTLAPGATVLEVGVATGFLGRRLGAAGFQLTGIEPNPDWAAQASPYYSRLLCCGLEAVPDDALRGFAAIICADVLEHLAEPERALGRLAALAPDGCRFVLSVPNVANIWLRLNLLVGRFDYSDRGLLDRTHLRFFTRRSLLAMVAGAGLTVTRVEATPIPLPLVSPFFQTVAAGRAIHTGLNRLTGWLPTLLGYQFVVQAMKPPARPPAPEAP